jgi:trehalose synthase
LYGTLALTPKALDDYRAVSGDAIDEIRALARPLHGLRVLHLSATAFGTGVAELLNGVVPLLNDIGLECTWQVVRPSEESAVANKAIYRALAGASDDWSPELGEVWLRYSAMNAELLTEPFDVIVVHDPQPAAIRSFVAEAARTGSRWVFHSHLDLSSAQPAAWRLLRSHLEGYNAIAFDTDSFVHSDLHTQPITIIPPAIDPLGPRNMELAPGLIETILQRYGVDPNRPLFSQLSPCDPSCDSIGAIDVYERVRRRVPGVQLALIAANPPEDTDSIAYFDEVVRRSMEHPDVQILRGVSEVGNVEMNAFQRASTVVIQKGFRKGFASWVSDAQWKERPVVTSRQGALPQQVIDGETGFLADSTEDFADRVAELLQDRALAARIGAAGHRHVAERFLLPRFLTDELRLFSGLLQGR